MRSTFKILFYINRNKVKADGTTAVLCRISIDGKQAVITTGIYCSPEDWNTKKGIIRTERANNRLMAFRKTIETTYEEILEKQGAISSELLKNTVMGVNRIPTDLLKCGEEEVERLRLRSLEIGSTSTYSRVKGTHAKLRGFITYRGEEDIALSEITKEFGEAFKVFLRVEGHSLGQINLCLRWLSRLMYLAVDREIIRFNPVADIEYEKEEASKIRYISKSDLKRIMETPIGIPQVELLRRAFIFSSFTALAYADIKDLYPRHIGKAADGRLYIRKKRVKTKVEAFIPLHPIAEQILNLYNTTDDSKPVFPLPDRRLIWNDIHQMGIAMGVKETISYHSARHSCGTLMLSSGLSIESVSKMMGHSSISSTQIYAKVTDTKISDDMDKLMERRKMMQNNTLQTHQAVDDLGLISE